MYYLVDDQKVKGWLGILANGTDFGKACMVYEVSSCI